MATYSDDFNRTDSADLGADWDSGYTGINNLQIVSNMARAGVAGVCIESVNAISPGARQFASVVMPTLSLNEGGVILRAAAPTTVTMYVFTSNNFGTNDSVIAKFIAGVYTNISVSSTETWANNDTIRGEAVFSKQFCYHNGTKVLTGSDATITASGRVGIITNSVVIGNFEFDDFLGGDIERKLSLNPHMFGWW